MKISYLYVMNRESSTEVIFLGTGTSQGVPMIGCSCEVCKSTNLHDKRLRSSIYIKKDNFSIIIDAGPDFRQQLLREDIVNVDAILLTHQHKDHTGGLDDVRAFNYLSHKSMPIYCENYVYESLKQEYSYAFCEQRYPGAPDFDVNIISTDPFFVGSQKKIEVIPIRGYHLKLPVLGFRIGDFAYLTDMNYIPEEEYIKLKGVDTIVVNSVRKERHISHFSLYEAIDVIDKSGAKRGFLTHLSHQIGCHKDLESILPDNIKAAYDGLKLNF